MLLSTTTPMIARMTAATQESKNALMMTTPFLRQLHSSFIPMTDRRWVAYGQSQSGIQRTHILLAAHTIDVCSKVTDFLLRLQSQAFREAPSADGASGSHATVLDRLRSRHRANRRSVAFFAVAGRRPGGTVCARSTVRSRADHEAVVAVFRHLPPEIRVIA